MATVSSLADDVYVLTNRPDLVSETRVAIRKAIFKFHSADTFKRDLHSTRISMDQHQQFGPEDFRWSIPLSEFERFRRPKYLRTPVELPPVTEFIEVSADNLFDSYRYEHLNYFYLAGSSLTVRAAWGISHLDLWYYQYPEIPSSSTDPIKSWICDEYPDAIIEEAAGTVFKMIGKDDEFNRYQTLFAENIAILRATDVGEGV